MPEQQNIEYKSVWKDEYLKWICGFANAQGGTLVIGKDDEGNIVGIKNSKKLLEELPNKITTILGIVADVNLYETADGEFIEIVIEPQPNPVNYKGEYHYRSGSTKQELKGVALDKFLLQKYGRKWDSVAIPGVSISELKQETFKFFKTKGIESKRLSESGRNDNPEQVLNERQIKAVLYVKEKGKITNSEYQEINNISRRTATDELAELTNMFELFKNTGYGAGSFYKLIAQFVL